MIVIHHDAHRSVRSEATADHRTNCHRCSTPKLRSALRPHTSRPKSNSKINACCAAHVRALFAVVAVLCGLHEREPLISQQFGKDCAFLFNFFCFDSVKGRQSRQCAPVTCPLRGVEARHDITPRAPASTPVRGPDLSRADVAAATHALR